MDSGNKLGPGEFLTDVKLVIMSPARRFSVIHERGVLWGSLFLLIAPAYFGFTFAGQIYFRRDPFPGYSFIMPAVVAAALQCLKVYLIHFFARLFEGQGHYLAARGRFRSLLVVLGYSNLPATLALILATLIFLALPRQIGLFFRDFRAVGISFLLAIGAAFFIWYLILLVLAMRPVYAMRDAKIVASFFLGSVLMGVPLLGTALIVAPANVDLAYLQPILNSRVQGILKEDPTDNMGRGARVGIQLDLLCYRFGLPQRFDLVAFTPDKSRPDREREHGRVAAGISSSLFISWRKDLIVGRIVGVPGDTVELANGNLCINGQFWAEPYLPAEFQSSASLPSKQLDSYQYFILPDDRRLVEPQSADFLVNRDRIVGRCAISRWPLGWWLFRPTVFLQAHPQ